MRVSLIAPLVIAFALSSSTARAAEQRCLDYGPVEVSLIGKVFVREDFGPPGYGEDPARDSRETHIYLELEKPVCVAESKADLSDVAEEAIKIVQMVYAPPTLFDKAWIGRRVVVTGTLYHAFTGHHWTPVLIKATKTRLD